MATKIPRRAKASAKKVKPAPRAPQRPVPEAAAAAGTAATGSARTPIDPKQLFPVAGVGASAGGLEAFTAFLSHLPSDPGMAFVLIQHLDPNQPSQLTDLLSKSTRMPVQEVTAGAHVEINHVYVIAPGVSLSISDGRLLAEPRGPGRKLPIDSFLRSLAQDKGSNAIGVILSGTASDGTLGLKAVKAEGGITFVQDPSSAKFDGMPRSAVAAGVADFVLAPADIAKRLARLARHPYVLHKPEQHDDAAQLAEFDLNKALHLLRTVAGNDFTHYKHATIRRRIHRRMVLHAYEKLSDYVTYLQENPAEVRALADDLLICVTSFFREPGAYEALARNVFPAILKDRSPDDAIRIWVPGCATGEEAYSVAISLAEVLESSGENLPFQLFATDVSETALEKARSGRYGLPALVDMSPSRLKRFFVKTNGEYQIHKSIRESCIFAKQNLAKDPPFHNLDLISCSNVLIYFGTVLQRKALSIFHYALRPNGFLLLGPSESVNALPDAFLPLDKKVKLYTKQARKHLNVQQFPAIEPLASKQSGEPAAENSRVALDVQKAAERMLLAQYAPVGVIVDAALNVVNVRGDTGPYLQLATGEPTYNLLRMAREGLVVGLRAAFLKASQQKTTVSQQVRVQHNGQFKDAVLKVIPINGSTGAPAVHFMILFEDVQPSTPADVAASPGGEQPASVKSARVAGISSRESTRLRQELTATREYLQSIIEEQEASTEELKSANEEAQASNEELETAKEELQSANEELNTVNEELKNRNLALVEANADLSNVMTSINVPLVVVSKDLKIRHFTHAMAPMLNLVDADVGRSLSDLRPNISVPDLPDLLRSVINGVAPRPREVRGAEGRWYSLEALPYRGPDNKIDGALIVLLDIDAAKLARDYEEAVVRAVQQPLLILSNDLKVIRANEAFYESFKVSKKETENRPLYGIGNGQWNLPELREALENILPRRREFRKLEVDHKFEGIGRRILLLSGCEIQQPPPFGQTILLAIEDITERTEQQRRDLLAKERTLTSERALRQTEAEFARFTRTLTVDELATSIAHEVNQPLAGVVTNAEAALRWLGAKTPKLREIRESLALIVRDANRASEVIKRVREFLKKQSPAPVLLDVNKAITEAISLATSDLEKNQVILRVELSSELPPIRGDQLQLQQVILNLIMNAREAMASVADRPREIVVTSDKSGGGVLVAVRDSGAGIGAEDLDKIFDAFFTTKPMGMGMGLSVSRSIVEAHAGRIWVKLNDGPGVTVQFTLPAESAGRHSSAVNT
jgi:two-component system CheB/CheR fusion protein